MTKAFKPEKKTVQDSPPDADYDPSDDEGELKPHEIFKMNVETVEKQIVTRLSALARGAHEEIIRCREATNAVDMARLYVNFRTACEAIKDEMKEVDAALSQLSEVEFPKTLEMQGLVNIPLNDAGRTVGVQVRTKASVKAGVKEDAIQYLRADYNAINALKNEEFEIAIHNLVLGGRKNLADRVRADFIGTDNIEQDKVDNTIIEIMETTENLEAIVVDHIFPQTLSSIAKGWAEEGRELPEEIFTTYMQTTTTWRKQAAKK